MRRLRALGHWANTPQTKGRVERDIQTLQDRLPKEMRLLNLCNREDGNACLNLWLTSTNALQTTPEVTWMLIAH